MAKLVIGCGYLGRRVARNWVSQGETVYALTRSHGRAAELSEMGLSPIVGDVTQAVDFKQLDGVSTVLYSVGFDRSAEPSIEEVYVNGLCRALAALPLDLDRIIYVSSSGVYGQSDGSWVDEESVCQPTRRGGQACLAAEQALQAHPFANRSIILRLAGIYGPGRIPKLEPIRGGESLTIEGSGYLNLIHVDDAVDAVLAAEHCEELPARILVSDGHPAKRADFYRHLAELLGAPPPSFAEPVAGQTPAGRERSNKRLRNSRMRRLLKVVPRFATYREGLAAILDK